MKNKETTINFLQEVLSGIMAGVQQHYVHATINKQSGFNKLGDRMLEESSKELNEAGIFVNRIIELGGVPTVKPQEVLILMNIEEQFKTELKEQVFALDALEKIIATIDNDDVTKRIFQDYLADEAEHTTWLKQQIKLIDSVGLKNYLATQI